jgi:hypothetical protein
LADEDIMGTLAKVTEKISFKKIAFLMFWLPVLLLSLYDLYLQINNDLDYRLMLIVSVILLITFFRLKTSESIFGGVVCLVGFLASILALVFSYALIILSANVKEEGFAATGEILITKPGMYYGFGDLYFFSAHVKFCSQAEISTSLKNAKKKTCTEVEIIDPVKFVEEIRKFCWSKIKNNNCLRLSSDNLDGAENTLYVGKLAKNDFPWLKYAETEE